MERVSKLTHHLSPNQTAAAAEQVIKYEVLDGRVCLITLNRPSRGNAYTRQLQEDYISALERANADDRVGVIVVTGAGKMFCVGADKEDLDSIDAKKSATPTYKRDVAQVRALELDKPIICSINGAAAGLGLVTACMADVRFASASAKFTTAFVKRGLISEHGINYVLPRIVGQGRALDLLLSSRVVMADEALSMGLVNRVYPDAETCLKEAIAYAREMVKYCAPAALAEIRRQMYSGWELTPRQDAQKAEALMLKSFKHPDFKEGVASLVEKRDPKFAGLKAGFIRDIA